MLLVGNLRVYSFKLSRLYTASLHNMKPSGQKIGIEFNKSVLVVEQNNYTTKIVNAYITYNLDSWPINPVKYFTVKNCLFGAINIVINSDKSKYVYSTYEIKLDGADLWSFGNDFAKNVAIFRVDNSSSSHTDVR